MAALTGMVVLATTAGVPGGVSNASAGDTAASPEPRVEHVQVHLRSRVLSATLRNGVVVHARQMPSTGKSDAKTDEASGRVVLPGQVHVVVALNGGEIFETFETRGVTLLAAAAFERQDDEAGADGASGARVRSMVLPDAVLVHIEGTAACVEEALAWLVGRLSETERETGIGDALIEEHRERLRPMFDDAKQMRRFAFQDAAIRALRADAMDARVRSPAWEQVKDVTTEQARVWAARLARESPIEVGVAGDMAQDDAVRLIARTLGGLANRPAVERNWRSDLRTIETNREGHGPCIPLGDWSTTAPIVVGFGGVDLGDVRGQRLMRATAAVLTDACRAALERSRVQWTSDPEIAEVEFVASPGLAYRNTGFVAAVLPSNGLPMESADSAKAIAFAVIDDLADRGPTLEALTRAVRRLVEQADSFEGDPWLWAAVLARSRVRGVDPEALSGSRSFYEGLTPGDIARALREHAKDLRRFAVRLSEK